MTTQSASPWDREPARLDATLVDQLLAWAAETECSDVQLMSDLAPTVRRHGEWVRVSNRPVTSPELLEILAHMYGSNAPAMLQGGVPLDYTHEVRLSRGKFLRFRTSATAAATAASISGVDIVFRVIPDKAPTIREIALESEIVEAHREVAQSQGLVLVVGATGTGKSTTLAAMISDAIEHFSVKVITYEAPIEFTFSSASARGLVVQTEIPRHVHSFAEGVSNALRRAPQVIVLGEARNAETILGAVQAALTGHAVYTTLHANSVAAALPRLLGDLPADQRAGMLSRVLDVLRLVMTQRLVRTIDGRRIALREYLVFDQDMRRALLSVAPEALQTHIHRLVRERGLSLLCAAERVRDQLAPGVFDLIAAEWQELAGHGA